MDIHGRNIPRNLTFWKRALCGYAFILGFIMPSCFDDYSLNDIGTIGICISAGTLLSLAMARYVNHNPHHFLPPSEADLKLNKSMAWIDWNHFICIMVCSYLLKKTADTTIMAGLWILIGCAMISTFVRMHQFSESRKQEHLTQPD